MPTNIYFELTRAFNASGLNAILSSGQAVVFHRLAIMSKDGDWILRETESALNHVLTVLQEHRASYRFGAPLDTRWMRGGWSAHLEFRQVDLRVRTDFVTRPPRLSSNELEEMWRVQEGRDVPVVDARDLIEIKKTNREKDYAVIGDLARLLTEPRDLLLASRSARDIMDLAVRHPDLLASLVARRPALAAVGEDLDALEAALDAERRVSNSCQRTAAGALPPGRSRLVRGVARRCERNCGPSLGGRALDRGPAGRRGLAF